MSIERDEWWYVHTTTPEKARKFFGLPPNTEVRESGGETVRPPGEPRCYAVRTPHYEWRYINAATAAMARAILGVPSDTVVEQYCARNPDLPPCWAVKVPVKVFVETSAGPKILDVVEVSHKQALAEMTTEQPMCESGCVYIGGPECSPGNHCVGCKYRCE